MSILLRKSIFKIRLEIFGCVNEDVELSSQDKIILLQLNQASWNGLEGSLGKVRDPSMNANLFLACMAIRMECFQVW